MKVESPKDGAESTETEQHIMGVPTSHTVVEENNFLVIFGKKKDIEKFIEINN